jgi:hypothetical protein
MGLGIKIMKAIFITTSLLFVGHFLTGFSETPSTILSLHKVGDVTIDMTVNAVYGVLGKQNTSLVDLYLEGMYSPALVVNNNGSRSIIFEIVCDKVWRIGVFDHKYKTQKGIGIGSTFGDLKKNYTISSIEIGEGSVFAYVNELEMSFCLDYRKEISGDLRAEQIGNDVRVLKIFVL